MKFYRVLPLALLCVYVANAGIARELQVGAGTVQFPLRHDAPQKQLISNAAPKQDSHQSPHWGYEDPSVWGELSEGYKLCGAGREQSPIDISKGALIASEFEPVGLHWLPFKPEFLNNGHTLQVNANGQGGFAELGGVRYELLQFHFHHQSEHTIEGKHAPMYVDCVHRNAKGDLLVVGAMIEEGHANADIDSLWMAAPLPGDSTTLDQEIDPISLVPRDHTSFRYAGSLTTPPCSEIVTWNVFAKPVTLSGRQIEAFASHYDNNARPIQKQGRRYVLGDAVE